jgi:hypothetical protein
MNIFSDEQVGKILKYLGKVFQRIKTVEPGISLCVRHGYRTSIILERRFKS